MKQMLMLIIAGIVVAGCSTGYTVALKQTGSNVVATGSGRLNVTGLNFEGENGWPLVGVAYIEPFDVFIETGDPTVPVTPGVYNRCTRQRRGEEQCGLFTGPTSFGSGDFHQADTGSGDFVGFTLERHWGLQVPHGYVSGGALSDSMTFNNATFESLGVTPGTYTWTWGTEAYQNFTLIIGPFKWWQWLLPVRWRFPFPEWRSWPPPWPPPRDLPRPTSGDRGKVVVPIRGVGPVLDRRTRGQR